MSLSPSLAKKCVIAKINGAFYELNRPLNADASLELVTSDSTELNDVLNHSCAHLLAAAIKELYPNAMFGVGPAIEEGFYYDMDLSGVKLTDEDLPNIEKKMHQIANKNLDITRKEVSKKEALELFKGDVYKTELINALPENEVISTYTEGNFTDLCRGPHLSNTKWLAHFKLLSISGAYWRGDSSKAQLQRIYGTTFMTEEALQAHLANLEERKKRDHKKLGRELDLFMISEYGPGFPFWLPQGMILRNQLENFWYDIHTREGYKFIKTPIMLDRTLWEVSGHWFNYRENMYTSTIDEKEFAIKPMNCPGSLLVYKNDLHSYKDLPLRMGELGQVHRHEASGALNGLFRVRTFTQDDAHIYCRFDQLKDEIGRLLRLFDEVYSLFNLSYHIELSTRPEEKYIGSLEVWAQAESALADALTSNGKTYKLNPGDGAFYGPKLDFKIRDSMGRFWQCGTIQLDMNLPERFDISYVDADGAKRRPVMLHRVVFGSIERFIGILIEHFAGAFPLWLAPSQFVFIPVNNSIHGEYVNKLNERFLSKKLRSSVDMREEKMNYKIREAQTKKIPYTLIIGDNEMNNDLISYRKYGSNETVTVPTSDFLVMVNEEIETLGRSKK
jgi:threonyl-tRNA synthetase